MSPIISTRNIYPGTRSSRSLCSAQLSPAEPSICSRSNSLDSCRSVHLSRPNCSHLKHRLLSDISSGTDTLLVSVVD